MVIFICVVFCFWRIVFNFKVKKTQNNRIGNPVNVYRKKRREKKTLGNENIGVKDSQDIFTLLPNDVSANLSSCRSMLPDLSLSNDLKHFCQSSMYFQSETNSSKLIVDELSRSNIPIIILCIQFTIRFR